MNTWNRILALVLVPCVLSGPATAEVAHSISTDNATLRFSLLAERLSREALTLPSAASPRPDSFTEQPTVRIDSELSASVNPVASPGASEMSLHRIRCIDAFRYLAPEIRMLFDVADQLGLSIKITGGTARDFALGVLTRQAFTLPKTTDADVFIPLPADHPKSSLDINEKDYNRFIEQVKLEFAKTHSGGAPFFIDSSAGFFIGDRYLYEHYRDAALAGINPDVLSISMMTVYRDGDDFVIEDPLHAVEDIQERNLRFVSPPREFMDPGMLGKMIGKWTVYRQLGFKFRGSSGELVKNSLLWLKQATPAERKVFQDMLFIHVHDESDLAEAVAHFNLAFYLGTTERQLTNLFMAQTPSAVMAPQSEIPRFPMLGSTKSGIPPRAPDANTRAAWQRLADFLIVNDPLPEKAHAMIVYGSDLKPVPQAAAVIAVRHGVQLVVPTGGKGRLTPPAWTTEGEVFAKTIVEIAHGLNVQPEIRARNGQENAEFAMGIIWKSFGAARSIICLQIPILSLRARKTLERFLEKSGLEKSQWPALYFTPAFETDLDNPLPGWSAECWAQRQLFEAMSEIAGLLAYQDPGKRVVAATPIPESLLKDALIVGRHLLQDASIPDASIQETRDRMAQIETHLTDPPEWGPVVSSSDLGESKDLSPGEHPSPSSFGMEHSELPNHPTQPATRTPYVLMPVSSWAVAYAARTVVDELRRAGFLFPIRLVIWAFGTREIKRRFKRLFEGVSAISVSENLGLLNTAAALRVRFEEGEKPLGLRETGLGEMLSFPLETLKTSFLPVPQDRLNTLRRELGLGQHERVIVIGSVHEMEGPSSEGRVLLRSAISARARLPDTPRILVVPRWIAGAGDKAAIVQEAEAAGLQVSERNVGAGGISFLTGPRNAEIIVINSNGELREIYALGDIAVVGNSLETYWEGHNVLEPVALGRPVLFGPGMRANRTLAAFVLDHGVGFQFAGARELEDQLVAFMQDPQQLSELQNRARAAAQTFYETVVVPAVSPAVQAVSSNRAFSKTRRQRTAS